METRNQLNNLLKKLVFPIPEDLYDINTPYLNTRNIRYLHSENWDRVAKILSNSSSSEANFLIHQVGILEVNALENYIIVNPLIYSKWTLKNNVHSNNPELNFEVEENNNNNNANSLSTSYGQRYRARKISKPNKPNLVEDQVNKEDLNLKNGKEEVDDAFISHQKTSIKQPGKRVASDSIHAKQKKTKKLSSSLFTNSSSNPSGTLKIEQRQLRPLKVYHEVKEQLAKNNINNLDNVFNAFAVATKTRMRFIKKSEIGHIKNNYMVIAENVNDLEKLVLNNGILVAEESAPAGDHIQDQTDKIDQYYSVLVNNNGEIIGDIVYYHNKTKNEILIPALEINATLQGQNLGLLLILHVMIFAQEQNNIPIKLQTGHHENAGKLKDRLVRGMRSFYIKLGFKLEGFDDIEWHKMNPEQKLAEFRQEHDQCVFVFEDRSNRMIIGETVKAILAYYLKETIHDIITKHCLNLNKNEKKNHHYHVFDLLNHRAYADWLLRELKNFGVESDDIEVAFKLVLNSAKSRYELETLEPIVLRSEYDQLNKELANLSDKNLKPGLNI